MKKVTWKKQELGVFSYKEAELLEKDGWRLPTRAELLDAFDSNEDGFDRSWSTGFWSKLTQDGTCTIQSYEETSLYLLGSKDNCSECFSVRLCKDRDYSAVLQKILSTEWRETELGLYKYSELKELIETHKSNGWRLPSRADLMEAYDNHEGGFDNNNYYWSEPLRLGLEDKIQICHFDPTNGSFRLLVMTASEQTILKNQTSKKHARVRLCRTVGWNL